jgi:hypothetical protein
MSISFLKSVKISQCSAITSYQRCNKKVVIFKPGIYFCPEHGNIILSPRHNIIYGLINDHSYNKLVMNNFFNSPIYTKNLINKRYRKVINSLFKNNIPILNEDVIGLITTYL